MKTQNDKLKLWLALFNAKTAELAGKLLTYGVSPDIIAKNSGLPLDKVKALVN